ncbi:MAG: hypothetical protein E6J52_04435 [Chloroflexi bacterium]|nr:MAG: hypothetical protein E6J52_04435 [Chloroflexota bacterium]
MKRRTLDIIFASGGVLVAALLVVLGFALTTQYAFATDYVKGELGAQKITFATADKLTAEETSWKPGSACLVAYAGQQLETGAQAECYAKYYIARHMDAAAVSAGFPGATYATLGTTRTELSAQVAAAKAKNDTAAANDAQKKLDAATTLRTTMQTGETLRGLLLTTYGFSVLGDMAGLAANIIYGLAILVATLSVAGFIHAFVTPKDQVAFGSILRSRAAPTSA